MARHPSRSVLREILYTSFFLAFMGAVCIFLGFVGLLIQATAQRAGGWSKILQEMTLWFDPIFTQYNLIMMLFAVLIAPLITVFYVYGMHDDKLRRLKSELPAELWATNRQQIEERVAETFSIRHFIGSLSAITVVVLLGCGIIMLLKPLPLSREGHGVDYTHGANFLMLGPFMENFLQGKQYLHVIVSSLTGFQFGFLGAYIYFIGHLVRSYFMLDLTPNTFVTCCVRIVTGAVLALVLSFVLQEPLAAQPGLLPAVAFFIGFFPSRGLLLLERISLSFLKLGPFEYAATPLSHLHGMSYLHEVRFTREGYDNIENLAQADPLELSLRTGFSYSQLRVWISQAQLAACLGDDYAAFYKATGMDSMDALRALLRSPGKAGPEDEPLAVMDQATGHTMPGKIKLLCQLALAGEAEG